MSHLRDLLAESRQVGTGLKCFELTDEIKTLTVVLDNGAVSVFPWSTLVQAKLTGNIASSTMEIVFSIESVAMRGSNLLPVIEAVSRFQLRLLRVLPPRYALLASADETQISTLEVKPRVSQPLVFGD